jgi:beta-mannosidase
MTAYTEFGIPSMPEADYLRTFIPEEELFPPVPGGTYQFHHAFYAWGGSEPWLCRDILEYYFGQPENLEQLVEGSKWLQREGYKAVFEEARRQKPFCSMAINWCYNEPWKTAANNSIICYPDIPKAGYYAIAESCRDLLASAKIPKFLWYGDELFTMELWMLNDGPKGYPNFTLQVYIEIGVEKVLVSEWRTGSITANQNKKGPGINYRLPDTDAQSINISIRCLENDAYSSYYKLKYRPVAFAE